MSGEQNTSGRKSDLMVRLLSALVLVPVGLFCVWYGGLALTLIAALGAGAMAFEWARMAKARAPYIMIVGTIVANLMFPVDARWALMCLVAFGLVATIIDFKQGVRGSALLGTLYAGGIPLAMQYLRAFPDAGWAIAMGVMVLSWSSDTGAYFAGRQFGGPLLAPKDSPNKTWSGAIGGFLFSGLAGGAFAYFVPADILLWGFIGLFVSVTAQLGDLFESQVKRRHNVKDTSGFLPGHGGVMDRLDGFGVACIAMVGVLRLYPEFATMLAG